MEGNAAFVQGMYFLLTGLWPLASIDTFQMVTGSKTDIWLVRTVGALVAVIGGVLLFTYFQETITTPIILLGIGSALALLIIDVVYVTKDIIEPIYLLDAIVEAALIIWWLIDI